MAQLSPDRLDAQLETCTAQFADLVSASDPGLHIPTCPDWTLRQLATHVGRAHRWAAEIVRTRAVEGIPFREVPDGAYPAEPAERDAWLRAGARRLTDAAGEAGTDIVWSFVGAVPATFWTRRMAHETLVHLADAQLAAGQQPAMDPAAAADAIDEWLSVMSGPNPGSADDRAAAMPVDAVMHVHATDDGLDGGEWQIRNTAGGIVVSAGGHGSGDVGLSGPAQSLLLVLMGRLPQADPGVSVHGDGGILAAWLDVTRF
jgi:uncharacterized protein (TIGR03083 family)